MQFSIVLASLAFLASITRAVPASLDTRGAELSLVNVYDGTNCNDYITTISTSSPNNKGANNGECFPFLVGKAVDSAKVDWLLGSCTITVYTDEWCSDHATAAYTGSCVSHSKGWKSFSTDNCSE